MNEPTVTYSRGEAFCPHCECDWMSEEPVVDASDAPQEGAIGICAKCRKWWEIKDGKRIKYQPTQEDIDIVKNYLLGET